MNPIALAPLSVLPASPTQIIDAASAAGFDAVGLRLRPGLPSDEDVMANRALLREVEQRLDATGMKLLDIEVFRIGRSTDVKTFVPAMEYGARLGARYMLCTSMPGSEDTDEARVVDNLAELCEIGAALGIKPMIEFMIYRHIGTLEHATRIAELVAHPNIGICVDALHLSRSGGTPGSLGRVDPALLCYAQISDAPAIPPDADQIPIEARFSRMNPGEGSLPLMQFLDALPAGTPLSVEVPDTRAAHVPIDERARTLAHSTRTLLDAWRAQRQSIGA